MEQQKAKSRQVAKMTAEEKKMFDELIQQQVPDFPMQVTNGQFDYAWTIDQRMKYLLYKYKLDPIEIYIDAKTNKTGVVTEALVIKAAGWYKIGQAEGWDTCNTEMIAQNIRDGNATFKATLFKNGSKKPWTGTGYCGRDESGKNWWGMPAIIGTAETRSIVRAIKIMCPIGGVISEDDKQQMENNPSEQAIQEAHKMAEYNRACREEAKLLADEKAKAKKTEKPAPKPVDDEPEFPEELSK